MTASTSNKLKIVNDPVYGFIQIPTSFLYELIEHPFVQRLRRIRQLGLTFYVYPGANHNRFQHALGATHLMSLALEVIERKGTPVTPLERQSALAAILLHDIGHGPFSHALERSLVPSVDHEQLSLLFMHELNKQFDHQLDDAIRIFEDLYPLGYLHQLVTSQLDMDRLDYLRRDSFFTGVSEGVFGSDRIIKMLKVQDDRLVVEYKGIYSIEKYLISRRLMYWQVYLHKTVVAAEQMLVKVLQRAKFLMKNGSALFATPSLSPFLMPGMLSENPLQDPFHLLSAFAELDDNDIFSCLKVWAKHSDPVLSLLSDGLLNRKLLAIRVSREPVSEEDLENLLKLVTREYSLSSEEAKWLVFTDRLVNHAYSWGEDEILLIDNSGQLHQLSESSDIINVPLLSRADHKFFLCHPKLS